MRTSPPSDGYRFSFKETHKVFMKYQMAIHKESAAECSKNSFCEFLVNSPLEVITHSFCPQLLTYFLGCLLVYVLCMLLNEKRRFFFMSINATVKMERISWSLTILLGRTILNIYLFYLTKTVRERERKKQIGCWPTRDQRIALIALIATSISHSSPRSLLQW